MLPTFLLTVCCPFIIFELHTVPVPVKSVRGYVQCNANQQESQQSEEKCKAKCKKLPLPHSSKFYVQTNRTTYRMFSFYRNLIFHTGVKVVGDMCHHNERIFIPVPFFLRSKILKQELTKWLYKFQLQKNLKLYFFPKKGCVIGTLGFIGTVMCCLAG